MVKGDDLFTTIDRQCLQVLTSRRKCYVNHIQYD